MFENMVLSRMSVPETEEVFLVKYYSRDQIKEDAMDEACGTCV
jgi:hypothetical protein